MAGVVDKTLFSLVHDFFKVYLPNQKHSSPHTIRAYQFSLESLFDFVKTKKNIGFAKITFEMIDHKMVSAFLDWIEQEQRCSITTRNHRLNCIRSFYTYAANMEPTVVIYKAEISKVPLKKTPNVKIVKHMSESAVSAILDQPNATTKKGLRDQSLMILLYDTAARIQELLDIRLMDMHLGESATVTLRGKCSKTRTVPLMSQTVEHINNFIKAFHQGESMYSMEYLFYVPRYGQKKRMCEDNARRLINAYASSAKETCPEVPDNVHPHLFRHSRSMHLYQKGMDLSLLSQWLGHAQYETTLIYAHADTELKRKAIESATDSSSPLKAKLNSERYIIGDEEMLKQLYGLR